MVHPEVEVAIEHAMELVKWGVRDKPVRSIDPQVHVVDGKIHITIDYPSEGARSELLRTVELWCLEHGNTRWTDKTPSLIIFTPVFTR